MRTKLPLLLIVPVLAASIYSVAAQGTAFTYQGSLNSSGSPASGNYDMQFSVFTNLSGGTSVAGPITLAATGVTNGLFTVTLDFGANVFTGSSNWLDISVRTSGAGTYTELAPRQLLSPAPYAILAENASAAASISSQNLVIPNNVQAASFANGSFSFVTGVGNVNNSAYSFVGGIDNTNSSGALYAFLGGGFYNSISAQDAFIGGGQYNTNMGPEGAIVGGGNNIITPSGFAGFIGGGTYNAVTGQDGTVPGGENNQANGVVSFAAGYNARANHEGAFVWGDSQGSTFSSADNDSFNVRAQGGVNLVVGGSNQTNGNNVQFINEGIVPGMVISNNNAYSGHLRFRNYLEIQPNLANTQPGGLDVRNSNGIGNIMLDGSTGTVYASNFQSFTGSGNFTYGTGSVVGGSYSFVGGEDNTNNASEAFVGGGELNQIQSGSDTSVVGGGNQNIIYSGALGSTISGGTLNFIGSGALAATIGGGVLNTNGGISSFIGGGHNNIIQSGAAESAIVGGLENVIPASGVESLIVGGQFNTNGGSIAFVGGGLQNLVTSNGFGAVIGGGALNVATTNYTTIPGGSNNLTSGVLSFAAGANAQATNQGAFVWSDSQGVPYASANNDSFNIRAQGGVNLLVGGTTPANGNSVQFINDGIVPGMVISNNNGYSGHLRVHNYLEIQPNLANTQAGGLDVRNSNGVGNIELDGSTGTIYASNFQTISQTGDFTYGTGNTVTGQNSFAGGNGVTNQANNSFIGSGGQNVIQSGASFSAIVNGQLNTILGTGSDSTILGGLQNTNGDSYTVIAGGFGNNIQHGAEVANISGGQNNTIGSAGLVATIAGGAFNTNNGNGATIGAGFNNFISSAGITATIAGGYQNQANANYAVVGGGELNQANTNYATVPGGSNNIASGVLSFAAGGGARATNQGAFVWADSQGGTFASTNNDTFNVRAQGGVKLFVSGSGAGDGNTVQFIDEGGIVPGMVISNANANSGHLRFRNYLEVQPNLAGTTAGGLDVRNASGVATITLNGANGAVGATTFTGSGSGLTSLPAENLTGSLPGISGANLTALPSSAALLTAASQTFTGDNTFQSQTVINDTASEAALLVTGTRLGNFNNAVVQIENNNGNAGNAPALRVVNPSALNAGSGALSVSSGAPVGTANSIIAQFGNNVAFPLVITNDGSVFSASNLVAAGDVYARGTKLTSDRNAKENFAKLDTRSVLDKVASLPVTEWNYKTDNAATRHIGPVAQDFYAAFGLDGDDDKHISSVDESGVALAAIQGLNEKLETQVKQKDTQIEALRKQNDSLAERLNELEATVKQLAARR